MVHDRLQQLTYQVSATAPPAHPFDPLSTAEIDAAVAIVRKAHGQLNFNAVTLYEPRKAEMMAWLADPGHTTRPARAADIVAIAPGGKVYDGVVDLDQKKIVQWQHTPNVQPLITMEDLQEVEHVVRKDPKVIEQCGIIGIPKEDMHKVYCDRELTRAALVMTGC
jgi:primary-amine oxidase